MKPLRPFWRYYGGKWRAAPRYPAPRFGTIVEPFAGAAGYSLRYPDRNVVLVDCYPVICEIWRWLIGSSPADVRAVPCVEHVDDLPACVPEGARYLVGFSLNAAAAAPRKALSAGRRRMAAAGRHFEGWCEAQRERVASQVEAIKHWRVIEGEWHEAPDIEATWYVDPPYTSPAGRHYVHNASGIDFALLGDCCRIYYGQVIVCENEGADWLPFRPFARFPRSVNGSGSREVIWTNDVEPVC